MFWSALTCQRFIPSRPVANAERWQLLKNLGDRSPKTKALTGRRTPKAPKL